MSTETVRKLRHTENADDAQLRVRTAVRGLLAMGGLQLKDLAGPLGTTSGNVGHKMTGRNKWTLEDVESLAAFFGVEVDDIRLPDRWRPKGGPSGGLPRQDSNLEPAG